MMQLQTCVITDFPMGQLNDFFSVVKLASNIGFYTVADSPFTFVFQSLGMDVFKCIDSGFYFAGDADNEGVWRNDLIFQDKGTGSDD